MKPGKWLTLLLLLALLGGTAALWCRRLPPGPMPRVVRGPVPVLHNTMRSGHQPKVVRRVSSF